VPTGASKANHDVASKPGSPPRRSSACQARSATLERGDADAAHTAVAHERHPCSGVLDTDGNDTAHDIGEIGAAIGNVLHLDAGQDTEELTRDVLRRADAGRAVGELAGIGLGIGDQVGHRLYRQVVVDHEDGRHRERGRDRREVADRIEGHVCRLGRMVIAALPDHIKRVAVGGRLGDTVGADGAEFPAMFSTTKGWPQASLNFCAKRRAVTSVALPAVNPTTSLTGFSGQLVWAWSGEARPKASTSARRTERSDS
jgi:hypothetical protein